MADKSNSINKTLINNLFLILKGQNFWVCKQIRLFPFSIWRAPSSQVNFSAKCKCYLAASFAVNPKKIKENAVGLALILATMTLKRSKSFKEALFFWTISFLPHELISHCSLTSAQNMIFQMMHIVSQKLKLEHSNTNVLSLVNQVIKWWKKKTLTRSIMS